jgi:hypothetical protein
MMILCGICTLFIMIVELASYLGCDIMFWILVNEPELEKQYYIATYYFFVLDLLGIFCM